MVQNEQKASLKQRWLAVQPSKKNLFWAMVVAAIITMIVGFNWGGWVTGGTAQKMVKDAAAEAVINRLALICVDQFNQDPGKAQKLTEFNATSSYQKDNYVTDQGWATMLGDETPDRNVADACANLIAQINQ